MTRMPSLSLARHWHGLVEPWRDCVFWGASEVGVGVGVY